MLQKIFFTILIITTPSALFAWGVNQLNMQNYYHPMRTKEEFYSLYRENLHRKVENLNANIFWLEHAKKAPFDHPVNALAKIESEEQWKEYQSLFLFQVNFLMMKNNISLAEQYDKPHILFFNPPYAQELQEGFQMAKIYYKRAQEALKEALAMAKIAWEGRDNTPLSLDGEMDRWANMVYKIQNTQIYHEVNYEKEIIQRLNQVEEKINQLKSITHS